MPFVKLDCAILDSSLWIDRAQRDVFITALLMAEPFEITEPMEQIEVRTLNPTGWVVPAGWYGFIRAAGPGIVRRTGYAEDEIDAGMQALERLGSPDSQSRSEDFEGRRLVRVDGGYIALNYMKYRDFDYGAKDRMRRLRERRRSAKGDGVRRNNANVRRNVTHSREQKAESRDVKGSGSSSISTPPDSSGSSNIARLASSDALEKPKADPIEAIYQAYPRKVGKRDALKAIDRAVLRLVGKEEHRYETRVDAERWLWKQAATFAQTPAGQRGNLTPHPATWFNQSRYFDDPAEWQRTEESNGKRSVLEQNREATRAAAAHIERNRAGRDEGAAGTLPLLGANTNCGNAVGVLEAPSGPDTRADSASVRPGGEGVRVLAGAGSVAAAGGRSNRGPVW